MHPLKSTKTGGTGYSASELFPVYVPLCSMVLSMYFFRDNLFTFDNSLLKLEIAGKGLLRVMSEVKLNGISAFLIALSVQAGPGRC